jgi:hypothetical protein
MDQTLASAMQELDRLEKELRALESIGKPFPQTRPWGGAGLIVDEPRADRPQPQNPAVGYPRRLLETPFPNEVSWVLDRVYRIFLNRRLCDGCSKLEIVGRLGNAVERAAPTEDRSALLGLLLSMVGEGRRVLREMDQGRFQFLAVSFDGKIADDFGDFSEPEDGPEAN